MLRLMRTHLLRPYMRYLIPLLVLQLGATIASLYLPSLNGQIIDNGVAQGDTGYIMRTGSWMLGVSLLQIACTIAAIWLASRSSSGMARDVRGDLFARVADFSAQEVSRFGAPTLISRTTNDVQQVQQVTQMALAVMVTAPITMIGGLVMALREDVGLSWLVAVAVPALAISVSLIIRQMLPHFRVMQESVDSVNRILREQITGVRVVRAFVRENAEKERFARANDTYTGAAVSVGRLMAMAFPTVMIILNASTVAVLWFGAKRVESGDMQVGALTAFMSYLMLILMSVMMATFMSMMIPRASVSAGRINEVLATSSSVIQPHNPAPIPSGPIAVDFEEVTFAYPGAELPVLHQVSFTAQPGQTTAIIGSTGAGKTTAISLIPRLFDVTSGAVRLGGVDVREASLEDVWGHIGLVPQKPFLFSGTVASNLRYGNSEATDAQLWQALEIAQAADFVRAMPEGIDSPISQGGSNVSGGQRQRLSIARALVKQPPIYIFDDSFSALDTATDARLRAALQPATTQASVIVVAQRVSSIRTADQIVVLEDGRVVGIGTHESLLTSCETYQEIVESQASTQDAA